MNDYNFRSSNMPNYDKLLKAEMPTALESAIQSVDFQYENISDLMQANVHLFEELDCIAFAYQNRDDIFYVNREGRKLLNIETRIYEPESEIQSAPIFWLEESIKLAADDYEVISNGTIKENACELVTVSWGKTWVSGIKAPIRSTTGQPIAILFAGAERKGSKQLQTAGSNYKVTHNEFGSN
ncbi:hypothetical protein MLD52_01725 [Puniceicoccaceae bacterium K14]|nr:hypothetical protein [Puniceicoccaceae bacterium K14]